MNKEELRKAIVEELTDLEDYLYSESGYKVEIGEALKNEVAGNILAKIPEQIITEADIVEVLESFIWQDAPLYKEIKQIASQILQKGQGWEVVASGMMDYDVHYSEKVFVNGESLNNKLREFDGKNIEIAVREVK
ncbi:MAG: hypothetical protein WC554_02890 [Clostridia bacterium]|jgi:hypothetical protein